MPNQHTHKSPPTLKEVEQAERARARRAEASRLAQRNAQALEMFLAGAKLDDISRQLGWKTRAAAHKAIAKALEAAVPTTATEVMEMRSKLVAQLMRMHQPHYVNALRGDTRSAEIALKIMDRTADLLGLKHAPPAESVVSTAMDDEIERLLADLPGPDFRLEPP